MKMLTLITLIGQQSSLIGSKAEHLFGFAEAASFNEPAECVQSTFCAQSTCVGLLLKLLVPGNSTRRKMENMWLYVSNVAIFDPHSFGVLQ